MEAKEGPVDRKTVRELGLSDADICKPRVVFVAIELQPEKSGGRKIDGAEPAAAAKEILKYIREEAKAL